ncbi:lasso peptide biosynthesis B2 protein [Amycolatopsis sp. NPDC004378]
MDSVQARGPAETRVNIGGRLTALMCLLAAKVLAKRPPATVVRVLDFVAARARPATMAEAAEARRRLLASNIAAGRADACLRRSLAIVLLCRVRGSVPVWRLGVRREPPFYAHAWVEAEGGPVGEFIEPSAVVPMLAAPTPVRKP